MLGIKSKITKAVLGYFMMHGDKELYVNEMARRLSLDQGNLNRKLKELEKEGILKSRLRGKERYYSLNTSFALFPEYRRIILKTVGFEHILKGTLHDVKGLKHVYLFGSYAQDVMDLSSDVDVLAIGDHSALELQKKIAQVQKSMEREINVVSMSESEYQKRLKSDPFVRRVYKGKKIQII